ncbi:unnamed protein product [Rotaria sp. Silwood2]|nr:unnamed protein product [Rotaria sp. Silwood2]CAF3017913.1 unnamed protein product [Rotaria sp. Silwood2]
MPDNNIYSKHYASKRRTNENNEIYHVVIFSCDNSFSVVKSKQCTRAEQDGFVCVQSGGKKYTGFVFESGTLEVCSKAADLLSQKQNEEIESDYERGKENNSSKDNNLNISEKKTFTSLKDVPFSLSTNTATIEINPSSPQYSNPNTINMNHAVTPIREKTGGDKDWQRTRNESRFTNNRDTNTINTAGIATSAITPASSLYTDPTSISSSLSKNDNDLNLILISLENPADDNNDEGKFPSSLIFKTNEDEPGIDLIKVPSTKEKANLYVTQLIEIMYTMEQLVALKPADTYDDDTYKLIQEAVRIKFKLSDEQLEQLFREWLREVFLAKRRVAVAKLKNMQHSE